MDGLDSAWAAGLSVRRADTKGFRIPSEVSLRHTVQREPTSAAVYRTGGGEFPFSLEKRGRPEGRSGHFVPGPVS